MTHTFTASGLFGTHFSDAEIAALFTGEAFLRQMLEFEAAWTQTLMSLKAVDAKDGEAALEAIQAFEPDMAVLAESSETNGLPVPGLVAQLRDGLPETVAKAIHTGTTSQDVIDTAMVRTLLRTSEVLAGRLAALIADLGALSEIATGTMMGRTRMQAALPIPVSARIQSWAGPLRDHLERLDSLRAQLGKVQLGGPVGLRDVPEGQGDAAAAELARRLGLRVGPVWHANRTPALDAGHWCVLVTGTLGKMGQDIALMAQQGVDAIKLSGGGGSSAMPHKQNPVRAETLVTLARFVAAQQGGLSQVMVHEQERSGAMWGLEWMLLPPIVEATGAALNQASKLISQIDHIGQV